MRLVGYKEGLPQGPFYATPRSGPRFAGFFHACDPTHEESNEGVRARSGMAVFERASGNHSGGVSRVKGAGRRSGEAGLVGEGSAAKAEECGSRQSQSSGSRQIRWGEFHLDEPGSHQMI